ncbi:MAG: hypothetical protein ACT4OY_07080, partial [Alphaproteobacteria bacterium]
MNRAQKRVGNIAIVFLGIVTAVVGVTGFSGVSNSAPAEPKDTGRDVDAIHNTRVVNLMFDMKHAGKTPQEIFDKLGKDIEALTIPKADEGTIEEQAEILAERDALFECRQVFNQDATVPNSCMTEQETRLFLGAEDEAEPSETPQET